MHSELLILCREHRVIRIRQQFGMWPDTETLGSDQSEQDKHPVIQGVF